MQLLEGILVLLDSLLSRQEHGSLVEVQDDVVEQEIANFKHNAWRLDGGIRPRHLPVRFKVLDDCRSLGTEVEPLADHDAEPGDRLLLKVFFNAVLDRSHFRRSKLLALGEPFPFKRISDGCHANKSGLNLRPVLWSLQSAANMLSEQRRVVNWLRQTRFKRFQHRHLVNVY